MEIYDKTQKPELFFNDFVLVLSRKMSIVTLSDAFIKRLTASDGRILRDRTLCGLCLKAGKRTRTFLIATSVSGKQFRCTIGRWPIVSVDEARALALPILLDCRRGLVPPKLALRQLPTLVEAITNYCEAKKLKDSSRERYLSIVRTHFATWQGVSVDRLTGHEFAQNCHQFAQNTGAAVVDVGRGLIGALFKFLNATYDLSLDSPFVKLAAAGLMPDRAMPRARRLAESGLEQWRQAVDKLPEKQRDYLLLVDRSPADLFAIDERTSKTTQTARHALHSQQPTLPYTASRWRSWRAQNQFPRILCLGVGLPEYDRFPAPRFAPRLDVRNIPLGFSNTTSYSDTVF